MGSFRELRVWNQEWISRLKSTKLPKLSRSMKLYGGLAGQLQRAAVSIPSNIAEGKGHRTDRECMNFPAQARGSLCEAETQLELARRLGYLSPKDADVLRRAATAIGKGLAGLMNSMKSVQIS